MWILFFIVIISLSILLHEAGHFLTAKLFGMKVIQFFIGFGSTIWSFKKGETEYGIKAIPAGGYVRIVGMNPGDDQYDEADEATGRLFFQQAAWKRYIVLLAGVATHMVLAALLMWVAFVFIGRPLQTNTVASIVPGGSAQLAGLVADDKIVAINDNPVDSFQDLLTQVSSRAGKEITLTFERDAKPETVSMEVGSTPDGRGIIGVYPQIIETSYTHAQAWQEITSGEMSIPNQSLMVLNGLTSIFSPSGIKALFTQLDPGQERQSEAATSLIGVGQIVNALGNAGQVFAIFMLLAQLNVMLGVLNVLPLPPFDGGHVAVLTIEQVVSFFRRLRGNKEPYWMNMDKVVPVALVVIGAFLIITVLAMLGDFINPASNLVK